MLHNFDIFEKFPDGSAIRRIRVVGQYVAKRKLQEFAEHSDNEFFAIDLQGGEPLLPGLSEVKLRAKVKSAPGG